MNYESMSDFEINKAVAKAAGHKICDSCHDFSVSAVWASIFDNECYGFVDYCNNPDDMWPLIEEMILSGDFMIKSARGIDCGRVIYKSHATTHANPLRAAAICYLMVKTGGE